MARDDGDRIGALLRAALRWEASAPFVSVPHMAIVGGRHVAMMSPSGLVTARRGAHLTPRSAVGGGRRIYAPSWTFGHGAPPPPHGVRFVAGGRHALARFAASDRAQSTDSSDEEGGDDDQWQPTRDAGGRRSADSTPSSSSSTDGASDTDTDITADDDSENDQDDDDDSSSNSSNNHQGDQRQSTDDESTASDDSDDGEDGPRHLARLLNDAVTRSLDQVCASAPTPRRVLPDLPAHRHCTGQHGEGACAVCLDDFSDGDWVRALPCAHTYHAPCIDRWLVDHDACPCCRAAVAQHASRDGVAALAVVRPVDPAPMPAWMNGMLGCGP
nr:Ring finger protein [Pandoravirus belohorizontensis]